MINGFLNNFLTSKRKYIFLSMILLSCFFFILTVNAETLDQESCETRNNNFPADESRQGFVTGTGVTNISSVALKNEGTSGGTFSLCISDDEITKNCLISENFVTVSGWHTYTFSEPVDVSEETAYWIWLHKVANPYPYFGYNTTDSSCYDGTDYHYKDKWSDLPGRDILFKTYYEDPPVCGNGLKEGTELCDEGDDNGYATSSCDLACNTFGSETTVTGCVQLLSESNNNENNNNILSLAGTACFILLGYGAIKLI